MCSEQGDTLWSAAIIYVGMSNVSHTGLLYLLYVLIKIVIIELNLTQAYEN